MDLSDYRTVDFRPAPLGWRLAYYRDDGTYWLADLPGWIVEEDTHDYDGAPIPPELRERTVRVADHDGYFRVDRLDLPTNVVGPFGPSVTDTEIAAAVKTHLEIRERLTARR